MVPKSFSSLPKVSHQIREETLALLISSNTFRVSPFLLPVLLDHIGESRESLIRRVVVDLHEGPLGFNHIDVKALSSLLQRLQSKGCLRDVVFINSDEPDRQRWEMAWLDDDAAGEIVESVHADLWYSDVERKAVVWYTPSAVWP